MGTRNIKLTVTYDGSEYHGWQIQPGVRTIQGTLTEAIRELVGAEVRVFGASRTDAGVSALGQIALVQIDSSIPVENLARVITHRLPPEIAVAEAVEVPQGFDLMGDVKSKLYRYTIFTGQLRPVLQIKHCWHLPAKLDIAAMGQATAMLIGKKDFKSFAAAADTRQTSVRTIFRCDVDRNDDWVYIDVEGDSFLYNMVRNIVGTLVEVGRDRLKPEKINEILAAKDRTAAGPIAPAEGLCLMWIKYKKN
ncbi:MAG: tRNA pseudouridine(38-40) synthase TruA [Phycisphaerae bacterium]|nr:tRNA pseudouridine(38-40) synthase TruA [Phycisphaerae bacterium]NIP50686.1 tRNA pseudouridine(38-40) synthase TruA [Phycisphaerae bacterium]NIS52371.1 tRNA pseudouridine(38-40) synthase TruA [Phycisphaerae bacterium]NIU11932.1 tRNA pseudouridine(38-40) synthase TruA [Phycisphaerae bacterium]NIU57577.1 tRNA pseudouridine(38-40) synthase TruA [Phycisphaerae bacterium]